jgi:uncharacterized protein (TIGR02757 family)
LIDQSSPDFDPKIAAFLEEMYSRCDVAERLSRDPLAIVKRYSRAEDLELAGLVCSTLAFGSVGLIMDACARALEPLGGTPAAALDSLAPKDILSLWSSFQYRFCFPRDIAGLLLSARRARLEFGSLQELFLSCAASADLENFDALQSRFSGNLLPALSRFVQTLRTWSAKASGGTEIRANLLPDPADGSACKRLFLFLRWMVRKDAIDPGPWNRVSPSVLVVPMDTHMAATCRVRLGFLRERRSNAQPSLRDALEVTRRFTVYSPEDPVKYDFALTRPGIDPHPGDEVYGCL